MNLRIFNTGDMGDDGSDTLPVLALREVRPVGQIEVPPGFTPETFEGFITVIRALGESEARRRLFLLSDDEAWAADNL